MCFNVQAAWNKRMESLRQRLTWDWWLQVTPGTMSKGGSGMMPLRWQVPLHKHLTGVCRVWQWAFSKEHLCIWYSHSDTQMQASFTLPAEENPVLIVQTKARHHPCQPFFSMFVGKTLPEKEEAPFSSEAFGQSLIFQRKPVKSDCLPPAYSSSTGPGGRHGLQTHPEEGRCGWRQ